MTTTTVSTEQFSAEAERRLIDAYELMQMLGLRSREALLKRVSAGTLAPPVYRGQTITLWDRDAIPTER